MGRIHRELGRVTEMGDPNEDMSVTWIFFPGLTFLKRRLAGKSDLERSIPVSTQELVDAGTRIDLEAHEQGVVTKVWAYVNVWADAKGDVQPREFEPTSSSKAQIDNEE